MTDVTTIIVDRGSIGAPGAEPPTGRAVFRLSPASLPVPAYGRIILQRATYRTKAPIASVTAHAALLVRLSSYVVVYRGTFRLYDVSRLLSDDEKKLGDKDLGWSSFDIAEALFKGTGFLFGPARPFGSQDVRHSYAAGLYRRERSGENPEGETRLIVDAIGASERATLRRLVGDAMFQIGTHLGASRAGLVAAGFDDAVLAPYDEVAAGAVSALR